MKRDICKQFFDFNNEKYNYLFCVTLYNMVEAYPNSEYLHQIISLKNIQFNEFVEQLATCFKKIKPDKLPKILNRSPHELKSKAYLWPYYSIYHTFQLYSKKLEKDKDIEKIIYLVYLYHYYYEVNIHTDADNLLYKLEQLAIAITRSIEILAQLKMYVSEDTYEKYFDTNSKDLFLHFIDVMDHTEIEKYKVVSKKSKNYIRYTESETKEIDIEVTRVLNKSEYIINSIISNYQLYVDFISGDLDLTRKRKKYHRSKPSVKSGEVEEVEQKLVEKIDVDITSISKNKAELNEQLSKQLFVHRELKEEPVNLFRQRLRNRAYSANVAKQHLISTEHYDIPPLNLLKEFIATLSEKVFEKEKNDDFEKNKIFSIIFIFGVLTAQSYYRTIHILLENFDEIKIKLDNGLVRIKIDDGFFAKQQNNDLFEKKVGSVYFSIPYLLSLALHKIQKSVKQNQHYYLSEEAEDEYHKYIGKLQSDFYKTIFIDTKRIDKLSRSYLADRGYENITTMFCTAIYSQNDTSKMAYASIHKKTEYFSDYIQYLYDALEIDRVLNDFLGLNKYTAPPKKLEERVYAGSNLLVKRDKVVEFFNNLYDLICYERDIHRRFNFISIYVRYAMSLLAGTRTFTDSADLTDVSYVFKIMKLSEKSETKLSGLRIVPLCDEVLELIQLYKQECKNFEIDERKFHLYIDNSFTLFSAESIVKNKMVDGLVFNFISTVPLNFGRHIFTKVAIEQGIAQDHIDAFLGHYTSGLEQIGIYSTLDIPKYTDTIRELMSAIASMYGVRSI